MTDIRVLIVDDVAEVRQDLRTLLGLTGGIEIVGEARNGVEALRLAETLRPEVILMDLEMPVLDGYEAARRIKLGQPSCRVVALTIHGSEAEQQRALQCGVDGFVIKGASLKTLIEAIQNMPAVGQISKGEES